MDQRRASCIGDGSWSSVSSTSAWNTIAMALAEAGKRGELRELAKIANTPAALRSLAAKLASHGWRLRFCYEAGP